MPNTKTIPKPLTHADRKRLEAQLHEKRADLVVLYEHDIRVGKESTDDNADDFADRANNSFNRELMFSLSDGERHVLIEIEDALQRLKNGSFGSCDHCATPIGLARLKAVPWARYCIDCQERDEKGLLDD